MVGAIRLERCADNARYTRAASSESAVGDPISARHSRDSLKITIDKDIVRIDPIVLRPHHDRIALLSDEQIDSDSALALIR